MRRQAARLQKCNLSVSFLLGCSIQTVPIQFAKKCRHDTPPSFSPARRGSTAFRFSAGSIRGHRRGLQEPFLRLLREMGRASAPERLPGPESRRKQHPGDQKEAGDARSTGLVPYRHDRRLRRRRACSRRRHQAPAQGQTQGVGSGRAFDASRLARYGKCHANALPNTLGSSRRNEQSIRPTLACPENRQAVLTGD